VAESRVAAVTGSRAASFTRLSILFGLVDFVWYIRNISRFTMISFGFQKQIPQILKFEFKLNFD
jgi:hypothetical protein